MRNLANMQRIDHFFCAERADSLSPGSKMSEGFGGIARERSVSQTGQDFGANDWLVEEMFERYQQDPTSIPTEWVTYFQNNPQGSSSGSSTGNSHGVSPNGAASTNPSALAGAPRGGTPPTPKTVTPPNISVQGSTQGSAAPAQAAAPAQPQAPVQQPVQPVVHQKSPTQTMPAQAVAKPIPTLSTPDAATLEPIRGVGARVVSSMEASLSVPTATSVRAIPAKLMIDNRIVINNHMKRHRGGKVSFTHIIAYAMIKALRKMPEMNNFYGEIDGKPALGKPQHINLGIAIDLAKADGTRQLLVPSIKGCEDLEFGQFWVAYEEIVKKARAGTLTVEDFAGTTVSLTNPGTIEIGRAHV